MYIRQCYGHRPEQSQDGRPVINSRFPQRRAHRRSEDLVPGESRVIIYSLVSVSSELSVVTQFFPGSGPLFTQARLSTVLIQLIRPRPEQPLMVLNRLPGFLKEQMMVLREKAGKGTSETFYYLV